MGLMLTCYSDSSCGPRQVHPGRGREQRARRAPALLRDGGALLHGVGRVGVEGDRQVDQVRGGEIAFRFGRSKVKWPASHLSHISKREIVEDEREF